MTVKVRPHKKTIKILSERIEECFIVRNDLWDNRTKFSIKHEDKLRNKIREIDKLLEQYFKELWDEYDENDELEFLDDSLTDAFGKTRWLFCDGYFHFVTDKKERLKYGYRCDC